MDRTGGEKTYWYYHATNAVDTVRLTEFTKMGGTETYSIPEPAKENGYVNLDYQFIVDFSQCVDTTASTPVNGYPGDSLKMTLEATVQPGLTGVPEIKSGVDVTMKKTGFAFAEGTKPADADGLTKTFDCTFTAEAPASKWDNRVSALVLTPADDADLPPDARIKAVIGGQTVGGQRINLYQNSGSFIIPMPLLKASETETVTVTLESALFPTAEASKEYVFTARWLIAPSKAGKSPREKYEAGELANVTFTYVKEESPSLKPVSTQRVLSTQDTLEVEIEKENIVEGNYKVSVELLRKVDDVTGTYVGTGWYKADYTEDNLSVPLGGQTPGSFCLMFSVKKSDYDVVMEVPYYFVIK